MRRGNRRSFARVRRSGRRSRHHGTRITKYGSSRGGIRL